MEASKPKSLCSQVLTKLCQSKQALIPEFNSLPLCENVG